MEGGGGVNGEREKEPRRTNVLDLAKKELAKTRENLTRRKRK